MLAQSFLSADDLELSERQRDALIKTLVLLETGKLTHVHANDISIGFELDDYTNYKFSGYFNMAVWHEHYNCGTVACIGGTAEMIGQVEFNPGISAALRELFYPRRHVALANVTVKQAAQALRNYLTTGHAHWHDVMGETA